MEEIVDIVPPEPAPATEVAPPKARTSPLLLIAAPLVLGFALWTIFSESDAAALPHAPRAPDLFENARPACDSGDAPGRYRAERHESDADAKSQRYPFAPRDGVEAVRHYRLAQACYAAVGDTSAARRMARKGDRLERRVELDYRTSRFRLSRALEHEDLGAAYAETRALVELTEGRSADYSEWLGILERRLRLAVAQIARP